MSAASDFEPIVGKPGRVTRYTSGSGTHTFLAGAQWARVLVIGGGGKGGNTGSWNDGFGDHTVHVPGGGGGGGEMRCFEFAPAALANVAYAVGVGGSGSVFHGFVAAAGANGLDGGYEPPYKFYGGLGGGLQAFGANDANTARPTAARNSYSAPGESGAHTDGALGGGAGGNSTHGQGGAGGVVQGGAYPAACNNGAQGSGYGAGGGGGGGASGLSYLRTLGAGANGTGGLIVVEEWVY